MMSETKPAHASMGVIGALAVLLAVVAQQLGLDFDEGQITEWLTAAGIALGGVASLIGRLRAKKRIQGV